MSLSDINALREYMHAEFAKMAMFIQTTNRTIQMMQESQLLLTNSLERVHDGLEDLNRQFHLLKIRQTSLPESPGVPPEPPEPSSQEQDPERSDIIRCPASNDEPVKGDRERVSRRNDVTSDSDK